MLLRHMIERGGLR